jgi:hypothetical protein
MALALAAAMSLGGCGKSKAPQPGPAAASNTAAPQPAADESAAAPADNPRFEQVLTLSLNIDSQDAVTQLQAMNGVDPKQTYGAAYELSDFSGCGANTQRPASVNLTIGLDNDVVMAWLVHEQLVAVWGFHIQYPNAQMPGYGTVNVFQCPSLTEKWRTVFPYLQNADLHHGLRVPLATREFKAWTYENRYDIQLPGKGSIKMFAGTFSYVLKTMLPGVTFSGEGTGSVKTYRDPDTGQWVVADYQQHDPTMSFETQ